MIYTVYIFKVQVVVMVATIIYFYNQVDYKIIKSVFVLGSGKQPAAFKTTLQYPYHTQNAPELKIAPKDEGEPALKLRKKKKNFGRIPGAILAEFSGKITVGQNRVLGWSWTLLTPLIPYSQYSTQRRFE